MLSEIDFRDELILVRKFQVEAEMQYKWYKDGQKQTSIVPFVVSAGLPLAAYNKLWDKSC